MTRVLWSTPNNSNTVILTKENNEIVILSIGDFITYRGRPDGVRIEEFTGRLDQEGPMGMTYLPWRKEESKWASYLWSMRGNVRHIIAFPCGMQHYGEQIEWNTVSLLNNGVCPVAVPVPVAVAVPVAVPVPVPVAVPIALDVLPQGALKAQQ